MPEIYTKMSFSGDQESATGSLDDLLHEFNFLSGPAAADDCPALVSSDEEEMEIVKSNDELVRRWLMLANNKISDKKTELDQEVEKIVKMSVGLFLLGMDNSAPTIWILAAVNAGIFAKKEDVCSLEDMDDRHLLMVEIADEIFQRNKKVFFPEQGNVLRDVLDLIDDIERNDLIRNAIIIEAALRKAKRSSFFKQEWENLKQQSDRVKKYYKDYGSRKPVCFMLLFFYKMVQHHVFYYGHHKAMLTDKTIHDLQFSDPHGEKHKENGNQMFKLKNYDGAIKAYSKAMVRDFSNYTLYGNRAQCYIYLRKYKHAYSDCRRAIYLKPDYFKGYYRGAEACIHLDRLDEAKTLNEKAQEVCKSSDESMQQDIKRQTHKILTALLAKGRLTDSGRKAILKELEKVKVVKLLDSRLKISGSVPVTPSQLAQSHAKNSDKDRPKPKTEPDSFQTAAKQQLPLDVQEPTDKFKFSLNVREALEAYNLDNLVRAAGKYQLALNLVNQNTKLKSSMSEDDVNVLRYALGITAVSQNASKTVIQEGLHMFQSMFKENVHKNFPFVIYGLAQAYFALHRFAEALRVINVQITWSMKNVWKEVCWPESRQIIEESKMEVFEKVVSELKKECRCPPKPDAVCFDHVDDHENINIYKDSPTYSGMVMMSCYERCKFVFHITCWKEYKEKISVDKISEKEVIDRPCPTPDCTSFIFYIKKDRPGKDRAVQFRSDQHPRKMPGNHKIGRMLPSNHDKIAWKAERKALRKQKKMESRQQANTQGSSQQPSSENIFSNLFTAVPLQYEEPQSKEKDAASVPATAMVVLQKEDEKEDVKYNSFHKHVRQKKKKEKENRNRNVLNVDFSFTEDMNREANRIGQQKMEEEIGTASNWDRPSDLLSDQPVLVNIDTFAVPPHLRERVMSFSNIVASQPSRNPCYQEKEQDMKKTLDGFLQDYLKEAGPQHLERSSLRQILEEIPEEVNCVIKQYGGIRPYFLTNSQFYVEGDCVGTREDAAKVCELADSLCHPQLNTARENSNDDIEETSNGQEEFYCDSGEESYLGNVKVAENATTTCTTKSPSLNPAAPVFLPGRVRIQDQQPISIDLDIEDESSCLGTSSHIYDSRNRLDTLDEFISDIDDIDLDDEALGWNTVDEVDINPSVSNSCKNLEAVPENLSRKSSQSDLSQTSSYSASVLRQKTSYSLPVSSHTVTPKYDIGKPCEAPSTYNEILHYNKAAYFVSPINTRNSSPSSNIAHTSDVSWKGDSPHNNITAFSPSSSVSTIEVDFRNNRNLNMMTLPQPEDTCSGESGFKMAENNNYNASYKNVSCSINENSSVVYNVPKPLKPLTPVVGTLAESTGSITTSSSSSVLQSSVRDLSIEHQIPFPSISPLSSSWSSSAFPASSSSVLPTNSFEDSIPQRSTSSLLPQTSVCGPFPSTPWAESKVWSGDSGLWKGKVETGTQVSVDVRSVEVNTGMTERDVSMMLSQQYRLKEMYQQMQQLHSLYELSQKELKRSQEEHRVTLQTLEGTQQDFRTAQHQLNDIISEFGRTKEKYAEREKEVHCEIQVLQDQNNQSVQEVNSLLHKITSLETELNQERNRSVKSEVQVIHEQMQNFKVKLDSKINEAERSKQQFQRVVHRWHETHPGQPLPEDMRDTMDYYQRLHEIWTQKKDDIMSQLSSQKEAIMAGSRYSDLPPITKIYLQLPKPPDGLTPPFGDFYPHPLMHPAILSSGSSAIPTTNTFQARPLGMVSPQLSVPRPPVPLHPPLTNPALVSSGGQNSLPGPAATLPKSKPQQQAQVEPGKAPPPPLRPISSVKVLPGVPQPRTATPPLAATTQVPASTANGDGTAAKVLNSFDKLVITLQKSFPTCEREHFQRAVYELRQAHNGTLSGLELEVIVRRVTQMLIARGFKPQGYTAANASLGNTSNNHKRIAPPPGISAAWSVEGIEPVAGDSFVEDENPCAICHDELTSAAVQELECGHCFHDKCIRTWFKQQTTCPQCRTYAPLLDEFPALK